MDPELVSPFVESVHELFIKLLGSKVSQGEIRVSQGEIRESHGETIHDFVAFVGLSAPARGTVSLSFPASTAQAIMERLVEGQPQRPTSVDEELTADGLGELVNIVAGTAKEKLVGSDGPPVELSLPMVVRGKKQILKGAAHGPWLTTEFTGELGPFMLGVTCDDSASFNLKVARPFVRAVVEFCTKMTATTVQAGKLLVSDVCGHTADFLAIAGLAGSMRGTVMLCFPAETALAVVSRLLGTPLEEVDEEVIDGLAEMVNIVAGTAKKDLVGQDEAPFEITLPSVLSGKTQRVDQPHSVWVEVSFQSEMGPFGLRVNFDSASDSDKVIFTQDG